MKCHIFPSKEIRRRKIECNILLAIEETQRDRTLSRKRSRDVPLSNPLPKEIRHRGIESFFSGR